MPTPAEWARTWRHSADEALRRGDHDEHERHEYLADQNANADARGDRERFARNQSRWW